METVYVHGPISYWPTVGKEAYYSLGDERLLGSRGSTTSGFLVLGIIFFPEQIFEDIHPRGNCTPSG